MEEFIKNPVKLKFDPLDFSVKREVREIFENKLARTLWMGIKQRHLTDQYFEANCLNASKALEKTGVPDCAEKLEYIITRQFGSGYNNKQFLEELLPYLTGKKNLEYEVVK
jgi:hypothetical protein